MAQEKIPFGSNQASGLDALGGAQPIAMNIIVEPATGAVRRRPGLTSYLSSVVNSQGITGLYETVGGDLFAVAGSTPQRSIYRVTSSAAQSLSDPPESDLRGSLRPVFAETEATLTIAGGAAMQKVLLPLAAPQGTTPFASSRLAGSPPSASSHVIANNDRLLANSLSATLNQAFFSNQAAGSSYAGFDDWTTALVTGFFSADSRPDPIVALHENTNEVFCFGSTSLQVVSADSPDPTTQAARFTNVSTTEIGCAAPYSVVKVDQTFAVLDHLRRFVLTDGHGNNHVISDPIQRTLNDMDTVSDCFGYRVRTGPIDLLVWTFPTDGRTFTFQQGAGWAQWSSWNATNNNWGQFSATAKTDLRASNDILLGTGTGHLGTLDFDSVSDLDGPNINAFSETGFISHGTENRKHCRSVAVTLRRGETTSTEEPCLLLSWRDGNGPWETAIPVSLGATGDYTDTVVLYSLGIYRRRQWRIEFSGSDQLVLVAAVEDFAILDMPKE